MLKSVQDPQHVNFNPDVSISEQFWSKPVNKNEHNPNTTVYRTKDKDVKHRLWFVLDENLVLPEYYVEYEYIVHLILDDTHTFFSPPL